jgi:hypothetical protein
MSEQVPASRKSGHKAAAIALWLVSTVVAIGIYNAYRPSQQQVRACIAMGGSGGGRDCDLPSLAIAAIFLVIFLGWGAAARAWRNDS